MDTLFVETLLAFADKLKFDLFWTHCQWIQTHWANQIVIPTALQIQNSCIWWPVILSNAQSSFFIVTFSPPLA